MKTYSDEEIKAIIEPTTPAQLQANFSKPKTGNSKSLQELLQGNPGHAGGLEQLADVERLAQLRAGSKMPPD